MRWLVTGAAGMLGSDLVALLGRRGEQVTATTRDTLDVTDPAAVTSAVAGHDVVVNCAAWSAVDEAETAEETARRANAEAPRLLARACAARDGAAGPLLVQVSTDYVFDGTATTAYAEDAPLRPVSAYGRTKAAGEEAVRALLPGRHLVVRTAWLYGAHGPCFPRTIARLARTRGEVAVVTDQVGQPTWTVDVAGVLLGLVTGGAPAGTYHATSGGQTSWYGFARAVVAAAGLDPAVVRPTTSDVFPRPARRPARSVLGHDGFARTGDSGGARVDPIGDWAERWSRAAPDVLDLAQPSSRSSASR